MTRQSFVRTVCPPEGRLHDLVRSGSVAPLATPTRTPLVCDIDRCNGDLWITRTRSGVEMSWQCDRCHRRGWISDWRQTSSDLSAFRSERDLPPSHSLVVTRREHWALRRLCFVSGECQKMICQGTPACSRVTLHGSKTHFEELGESILAEVWLVGPIREPLLSSVYRKVCEELGTTPGRLQHIPTAEI